MGLSTIIFKFILTVVIHSDLLSENLASGDDVKNFSYVNTTVYGDVYDEEQHHDALFSKSVEFSDVEDVKGFSYMTSLAAIYGDGGNSTLRRSRTLVAGLSHMYHANSTLLPKDCDKQCVAKIRSKRLTKHLRFLAATSGSKKWSVQNRANYVWLNAQKSVEWYVNVAVTDVPIQNAQTVRLVPDTATFLTWFQCKPCPSCYPQRERVFDPPRNRNTFRYLNGGDDFCRRVQRTPYNHGSNNAVCYYNAFYMDGTTSRGVISTDTFRFLSFDARQYIFLPQMGFGCGLFNHAGIGTGMAGVMGLARLEGVAFPEQTVRWIGQSFTYCLPIVGSAPDSGWLTLGDDSVPDPSQFPGFQSIPFPDGGQPDAYYLDAIDMIVSGFRVYIPPGTFDFHPDRSGGVMIDSGTMISTLLPEAYYPFRDAYRTAMRAVLGTSPFRGKFGMDTCYDITGINVPTLALPNMGYYLRDGQEFLFSRIGSYFEYVSQSGRPLLCLLFVPLDTGDARLSILGGYQQMQIHMAYEYAPSRLIWSNDRC